MIEYKSDNIRITPEGGSYSNYIEINHEDFFLSYLNPNIPSNKGASSNLFILHDPSGETEERVIKICKTPYRKYSRDKRIKRFEREIDAFKRVRRSKINGIIEFYPSGVLTIDKLEFLYIILERADSDLASFMEDNNFAFTPNQKLNFCINILNNFKKLHQIGIYHRDIKHDNILVVGNELKIGDLGLVDLRL